MCTYINLCLPLLCLRRSLCVSVSVSVCLSVSICLSVSVAVSCVYICMSFFQFINILRG